MKKDYNKLLLTKNSGWRDTIATYSNFFKIDLKEYYEFDDDYLEDELGLEAEEKFIIEEWDDHDYYCNILEINDKSTPELLESLDEKYNMGIPKELHNLYITHGAFKINECEGFMIFEPKDNYSFPNEFSNYAYFRAFSEETDTLSKEECDIIRERFFFWGIGFFESGANSIMYFYDKKEKYYGELEIHPDDCPRMKEEIFPALFAGSLTHYTLDEIIYKSLDKILRSMVVGE